MRLKQDRVNDRDFFSVRWREAKFRVVLPDTTGDLAVGQGGLIRERTLLHGAIFQDREPNLQISTEIAVSGEADLIASAEFVASASNDFLDDLWF